MADGVPCMLMRGGSSKGAYFLAADLPDNADVRDNLLLRIMGSPDERQIDGIGGAHPLTSKVAVVAPCNSDRADVEYLFLQVGVETDLISDRQNCGNLLAGVGPFAVERQLVNPAPDLSETTVRILMLNTNTVATATFAMHQGRPVLDGDTAISGVPGTAAAIHLDFDDLAGGSCGAMLPTGSAVDVINGVDCTLIDNGMPVVVMAATDLGVSGLESCADLEANTTLRSTLEAIRLKAGPLMNLGDVTNTTVPKMSLVAEPSNGGHLTTRTFIPHRCHEAIGVLGAVSLATAALLPGSPANRLLGRFDGDVVRLEHPTGFFDATIEVEASDDSDINVQRAGIVRTARKLMDGMVYPKSDISKSGTAKDGAVRDEG